MNAMKLEFAEDIYDIPYTEDRNGHQNPTFENYGRAQMSPMERKAVDLMNDTDPTALDMVNMSGLYMSIWQEIGAKAEAVREKTSRDLLMRFPLCGNYMKKVSSMAEIDLTAQEAAWESLRTSIAWLAAEVRSRRTLKEIRKIHLNMMTN